MAFFIQRTGPDRKPQYMRVEDGVPVWTTDPDQKTVWNSQQKVNNIIASQTARDPVGKPGDKGYIAPVAGFIKAADKAVVRETGAE